MKLKPLNFGKWARVSSAMTLVCSAICLASLGVIAIANPASFYDVGLAITSAAWLAVLQKDAYKQRQNPDLSFSTLPQNPEQLRSWQKEATQALWLCGALAFTMTGLFTLIPGALLFKLGVTAGVAATSAHLCFLAGHNFEAIQTKIRQQVQPDSQKEKATTRLQEKMPSLTIVDLHPNSLDDRGRS